jgi:hypothetical protein
MLHPSCHSITHLVLEQKIDITPRFGAFEPTFLHDRSRNIEGKVEIRHKNRRNEGENQEHGYGTVRIEVLAEQI